MWDGQGRRSAVGLGLVLVLFRRQRIVSHRSSVEGDRITIAGLHVTGVQRDCHGDLLLVARRVFGRLPQDEVPAFAAFLLEFLLQFCRILDASRRRRNSLFDRVAASGVGHVAPGFARQQPAFGHLFATLGRVGHRFGHIFQ